MVMSWTKMENGKKYINSKCKKLKFLVLEHFKHIQSEENGIMIPVSPSPGFNN